MNSGHVVILAIAALAGAVLLFCLGKGETAAMTLVMPVAGLLLKQANDAKKKAEVSEKKTQEIGETTQVLRRDLLELQAKLEKKQ